MTLILASASAARAQMLKDAGLDIEICPARIDEAALKTAYLEQGGTVSDVPLALARAKAASVSRNNPGAIVIGCDQVLVFGGRIVDKMPNLDKARGLLCALRGKAHELISAACLYKDDTLLWQGQDLAKMHMRSFSDMYLDAYLAAEGGAILSSVGCYQLEGAGVHLFDTVKGDYFTILGLPLLQLLSALRSQGVLAS